MKSKLLIGMVCGSGLLIAGCSSPQTRQNLNEQEERGKTINILNSLSAAQATQLREVGHYTCKSEDVFSIGGNLEKCRSILRFTSAGNYAELLVINRTYEVLCPGNPNSSCLRVEATGYVRKSKK